MAPRASLLATLLLCGFVRERVPTPTGDGPYLFWASRSPTYAVNERGSIHLTGPAQFSAVKAGFDAWSQPTCTDIRPQDLGLTPDTEIGFAPGAGSESADGGRDGLVVWRPVLCGDVAPKSDPCWAEADCDDTHDCLDDGEDVAVAVTSFFFRIDTGEIVGAGTELNDHGFVFSTVDSPPCDPGRPAACDGGAGEPGGCAAYGPPMPAADAVNPTCVAFDVQNTMTHEAGHFLGFGHTPVAGATMNPTTVAGDLGKRTLHPDDVEAVCTVYPAQPPQDAGPVHVEVAGGCACGQTSGGATILAVLLLALGVPRPRRSP